MKKVVRGAHMRLVFEPSLAKTESIFIDLYGGSYSAVTTKREAKAFAKYLRRAAKWVDGVSNDVGKNHAKDLIKLKIISHKGK